MTIAATAACEPAVSGAIVLYNSVGQEIKGMDRICPPNSDINVVVRDARNSETGALITTASVSARVLTLSGAEVSGVSWPVSLTHDSGTPGTFRGKIPYTATLLRGGRYEVEISFDAGAGLVRTFRVEITISRSDA